MILTARALKDKIVLNINNPPSSMPSEKIRAAKKDEISLITTLFFVLLLLKTNILFVINANITDTIHAVTFEMCTHVLSEKKWF